MKRRYSPYALPPWLRTIRGVCGQFIIPFTIFQAIRTLLLPTAVDVLLLAVFILIAVAFHLEWI
ncbi:hypothetical protein ELQ35_14455 [Peribacillus cavernae]|uniref:Uncharacterized protein n=1 Tax=Peribacillus cavernae TaxID=1674310 RepID=A0A3S0TTQ9_9BACI|nr:hypothetical protein [Peribacillus cavernae]MDQ0219388.1 hypothetical protein [Peribacillus cavernae]RUQ27736.1 hypothetical protein ELQ35_14455 [Peribacillus cavernae]